MADGENGREGRGEGWVVAQMLLLAAVALAPRRWPLLPDEAGRAGVVGGVLLGLVGALTAAGGALALGRNLTPFPTPIDDGELVEHGLYGAVRHPIYTGIILGAIGWAFARNSLVGLVLALVLSVFFDRKAEHEEQWLLATYPGYATYRQRVRKLIPWIH